MIFKKTNRTLKGKDVSADQSNDDRGVNSISDKVSLQMALAAIILLALAIVSVGYAIYATSNDSKYDLARPGDKDKNGVLGLEDGGSDVRLPIDVSDVKDKRKYLKKELDALKAIPNFSVNDLSDQNIRLKPNVGQ